ncbi:MULTISPECIES: glycoside hydrolase family 1 protein [Streptococcus]|uniref:Glycoside hydrolase family 1 protein n=1 Tax=Streptococcus caledonicus TaxID=2614158 RepID=A0ABW0UEJ8_9STRE|nr:glycoside hydrolase family 1 protein [Streptococcus sp. S784/96/1]
MTHYTFPKHFFWGSATSGPQSEGRFPDDGKGDNTWDYWFQQEPHRFHNGIGPDKTSQLYKHFREDIQLLKATGHNSFRTSIQWSRLFPKGTGEVNPEAVAFYNNYIDELLANNIEPFINLYHFDLPMALQEKGGWLNRDAVLAFEHYAKTCFELFGDRVRYWFTQNEPIVPVEYGYLYQGHYPCEVNLNHAIQVGFHSALASSLAIKAYREGKHDGQIGIILNLTPSYPRDPSNPKDVKAAQIADAFFNRSFLDVSVKGHFPKDLVKIIKALNMIPDYQPKDLAIIQQHTVDLLGINYYQPRRIKAKETPLPTNPHIPMPDDYFDYYDMPNKKINPYRGWEIYEKGIYDILINLRDHYGNIPCFIAENGMGVENENRYRNEAGYINDQYRIDFYKDHLRYVHQAITEGANCLGYHVWAGLDCWSWLNSYKNRYGLIEVDLSQNAQRRMKQSGLFFKQLSTQNGFSD